MTCSLSLICQTKPPAAPWIWSGSMRNHCGTALRMTVAWAAWAAIAWAAADCFLGLDDVLADDFFLVGIIVVVVVAFLIEYDEIDVYVVFVYWMMLDFHFNFLI